MPSPTNLVLDENPVSPVHCASVVVVVHAEEMPHCGVCNMGAAGVVGRADEGVLAEAIADVVVVGRAMPKMVICTGPTQAVIALLKLLHDSSYLSRTAATSQFEPSIGRRRRYPCGNNNCCSLSDRCRSG